MIIVRPNRGTGHALHSAQQVVEALRPTYLRALLTSQEIRVQVEYSDGDAGQLSPLQSTRCNNKSVYMCTCVCVCMYESVIMRVDSEVMAVGLLRPY